MSQPRRQLLPSLIVWLALATGSHGGMADDASQNGNLADGLNPEAGLIPPPGSITPIQGQLIVDPPVPYYTQLPPFDDPTAFDPRLELNSDEVKLGWTLLLELDYVKPFIHNGLNSGNLLAGTLPESVSVPSARPDWAAMPRIDLGYRHASGYGEFHAIFRTLSSQASATRENFDAVGSGILSSHLNLNVLDLDYAYTEFNPGRIPRLNLSLLIPGQLGLNLRPENDLYPTFRMKWALGARIANVFFDSRGAGSQILQERITNNFVGGGIHASVDFAKPLPGRPALGIFARFEVSGLFGDVTQSFARTETLPGGGTASGVAKSHNIGTGVPVYEMEAGLSYLPPSGPRWLRFTGGYRYEQWWYLGQASTSNAGIDFQGVFFRGEWGY